MTKPKEKKSPKPIKAEEKPDPEPDPIPKQPEVDGGVGPNTRTERLVQRAMAELRKGRTAFVIAHRLSTIKDADTILVMEHGAIVERGDHESLMAARGPYYRLYTSQFAGE